MRSYEQKFAEKFAIRVTWQSNLYNLTNNISSSVSDCETIYVQCVYGRHERSEYTMESWLH